MIINKMPQKKESQREKGKDTAHNTRLNSNNAKISRISSVTAMQSKTGTSVYRTQ